MVEYDFENFGTRLMKAEATASSIETIMAAMDLFDEAAITCDRYGSAAEKNRTHVWTISMTVSEAMCVKRDGE